MNPRIFVTLLVLILGGAFCQAQTSYYHDGSGSLHQEQTWYDNPNFTGSHPSGFNGGDTFIVQSLSADLVSSWSMSGSGTVLLLRRGCEVVLSADLSIGQGATLILEDSSVLEAGIHSVSGQGNLHMVGGHFKLAKLNTVLPELSGDYTLDSGKLEFTGNGDQEIRGSRSYYHIIVSGEWGLKTFSSAITGSNTIEIFEMAGRDTVDFENRTIGGSQTTLALHSGHLRLAGTGTKPDASNLIEIDSASIEYYNSSASPQTIRNDIDFHHLQIGGNNVKPSTGNIQLAPGGVFEIKSGATWDMTNTNVGIEGDSQSRVIIDGTFKLYHAQLIGSTSSAIREGVEDLVMGASGTIDFVGSDTQVIQNGSYSGIALNGNGPFLLEDSVQITSEISVHATNSLIGNFPQLEQGSTFSMILVGDTVELEDYAIADWDSAQLKIHGNGLANLGTSVVLSGLYLDSSTCLVLDSCELSLIGPLSGKGQLDSRSASLSFRMNESAGTMYSTSAHWTDIGIQLDEASILELGDSVNVTGSVTLSGGVLASNGLLCLRAVTGSDYGTLRKLGGNLDGELGMEFNQDSVSGWRYLNAPVQATLSDWHAQKELIYSGADQNVFRWDANESAWDADIDSTDAFDGTHVYAVKMDSTDWNRSFLFYGKLNEELGFSSVLTFGSGGDSANFQNASEMDGWNLIGNPLAATIDWESVHDRIDGNINGYHYIYDGSSGNYVSHNGTAGHSQLSGKVPPFQGFFIRLGDSSDQYSQAFNFDSTDLSTDRPPLKKKAIRYCRIHVMNDDGVAEALLVEDNRSTTEYHIQYDALFLPGSSSVELTLHPMGAPAGLSAKALPILDSFAMAMEVKSTIPFRMSISGDYCPLRASELHLIGQHDSVFRNIHEVFEPGKYMLHGKQQALLVRRPSVKEASYLSSGVFHCPDCRVGEKLRIYTLSGNLLQELNYNFKGVSIARSNHSLIIIQTEHDSAIYFNQ